MLEFKQTYAMIYMANVVLNSYNYLLFTSGMDHTHFNYNDSI